MNQPKLKTLKWFGVDFDFCICRSDPNDGFKMIEPMPLTKDALKRIHKMGKKIVVYTARGWEDYIAIEDFMEKYQLPYDMIVCGKLLVEVLIDDKAIQFKDWKQALHDAFRKVTD